MKPKHLKSKIRQYNQKVEKMASSIHESWARSRQTMINRYPTAIDSKGKTMKDRWEKDMIPYNELPEDVKEYDRIEAREYLTSLNIIPPYLTPKEKKQYRECVKTNPINNKEESRSMCIMESKLNCIPTWRDDPNRGCPSYACKSSKK